MSHRKSKKTSVPASARRQVPESAKAAAPTRTVKYLILASLMVLAIFAASNYAKATFDPGTGTAAAASVSGGVQRLDVRVLGGAYDPTTLRLRAGVPAEVTFSQSSGCTGYVQSAQLGFSEDLTTGPKTVKLAGLSPGTYSFACGMGMVSGRIVVE